ncbi:uncharacterized protein BDV14DRAFT_166508 [Aspergillus stella-maris]|uniref:uncharacterized protein n=1 Tax=Aspergillus stella-maris TaxID=1810926 RepID=UPI003CCCEE51
MRGRGPAYSKGTAVLGCIITVGKLLDIGSTKADRKDPDWHTQLSPLQQAYIELCEANWDLCSLETGAQMIRDFRTLIDRHGQGLFGDSHPGSVGSLWDTLSSTLGQFLIDYEESTTFCECMEIPDTAEGITTYYMTPPPFRSDSAGVTMQTY